MCLNKLVVSPRRVAPTLGLDSLRGIRSTGEAISSDPSRSLYTENNSIYTRPNQCLQILPINTKTLFLTLQDLSFQVLFTLCLNRRRNLFPSIINNLHTLTLAPVLYKTCLFVLPPAPPSLAWTLPPKPAVTDVPGAAAHKTLHWVEHIIVKDNFVYKKWVPKENRTAISYDTCECLWVLFGWHILYIHIYVPNLR